MSHESTLLKQMTTALQRMKFHCFPPCYQSADVKALTKVTAKELHSSLRKMALLFGTVELTLKIEGCAKSTEKSMENQLPQWVMILKPAKAISNSQTISTKHKAQSHGTGVKAVGKNKSKSNAKNSDLFEPPKDAKKVKFYFLLWKRYFETGYNITGYIKYVIAIFGISSLNVGLTMALGWGMESPVSLSVSFGLTNGFMEMDNEISNRFNGFVHEMRAMKR